MIEGCLGSFLRVALTTYYYTRVLQVAITCLIIRNSGRHLISNAYINIDEIPIVPINQRNHSQGTGL